VATPVDDDGAVSDAEMVVTPAETAPRAVPLVDSLDPRAACRVVGMSSHVSSANAATAATTDTPRSLDDA